MLVMFLIPYLMGLVVVGVVCMAIADSTRGNHVLAILTALGWPLVVMWVIVMVLWDAFRKEKLT